MFLSLDRAEAHQQHAVKAEEEADGKSEVKVHKFGWLAYQKMMFKRMVTARTMTPSVTGC